MPAGCWSRPPGCHKPSYRPGNTMLMRWAKAPGPVVAKAHQGNKRLHARWNSFTERHKRPRGSQHRHRPG